MKAHIGAGYVRSSARPSIVERVRLWRRLMKLSVELVVRVGGNSWNDEQLGEIARQVEDVHRDLGHVYYDWRTYGGTWAQMCHRGDGE